MTSNPDLTALEERLTFIGIDGPTRGRLKGLRKIIRNSVGGALDAFYGKVRATPQTARFFADEGQLKGAKVRQENHWDLIASAEFDARYVGGVSAVGKAHARLGLEPRWYIGGYALILEQLVGTVLQKRRPLGMTRWRARSMSKDVNAVIKAAMLDMDYAISIYLDELADARSRAEAEKARAEADQRTALAHLATALNDLANGNLNARIDAEMPGDFIEMAQNFNSAIDSLHGIISEVRTTSDSIFRSAEEMAQASDELSMRTEQQAASLEESAAALQALAQNVQITAENAEKTSGVVLSTQKEAKHSERVVSDAVTAMGQIQGSSEEIAAIVGVIDEIAFQTNLLALNAGVEAARAGEAGRGFAVVAQEVRGLAQRCASSAQEIKGLITTSGEHVASGVSLVGAAGDALATMTRRIDEINTLTSGIATAASEQSRGIAEVNIAVGQMDQITQRNAAMVEETSAETQRLKGDARELESKLQHFRLGAGRTGAAGKPGVPYEARPLGQPLARRAV